MDGWMDEPSVRPPTQVVADRGAGMRDSRVGEEGKGREGKGRGSGKQPG